MGSRVVRLNLRPDGRGTDSMCEGWDGSSTTLECENSLYRTGGDADDSSAVRPTLCRAVRSAGAGPDGDTAGIEGDEDGTFIKDILGKKRLLWYLPSQLLGHTKT